MQTVHPQDFTGSRAWEALPIATLSGSTTVRLHWTDQPYQWHVNDGHEVFVVLDGVVDMHTRAAGQEQVHRLQVGDIFMQNPVMSMWPTPKAQPASWWWSAKAASSCPLLSLLFLPLESHGTD